MSQLKKSRNNGNYQTVADLENAVNEMEKNFENVNKKFINKIFIALNSILVIVQHKEAGIFKVILRLFRLYLKVHFSINPDDKNLLKYHEKSVPTVISYIIGCLQYNTKEIINYHLSLLEILEELLENVQTNVLKRITKFEIGTIGCLWKPIDLAGDFNTQSKALKILTTLLKQFDETRQNEELKYIKWTNLNLFQNKLKTIVQETKLQHVLENNSRDLLNNYNMSLSKNILVYSFYCLSVILSNKYKFYKPLNHEKFWIDINYRPQTLSYKARFKLNRTSKYEDINVILMIQMMKLENNTLFIYFKSPGKFSKYSENFGNIEDNIIMFTLTNEEIQRLKANYYVMEYFNSLNETSNRNHKKTYGEEKDTFELLKTEMSTNLKDNKSNKTSSSRNGSNLFCKSYKFLIDLSPERDVNAEKSAISSKSIQENIIESPKSSRIKENEIEKKPLRKLRDRKKFFTSLLAEEDSDEEILNKKRQRKRSQNKKPRQIKSRYKQVCKVTPTVDLTKLENIEQNDMQPKENILNTKASKDNVRKMCSPLITSQDCAEVLKQVADIYNATDTSYVKPGQSYRNFKIEPNPMTEISNAKDCSRVKSRKTKVSSINNEADFEKKRKLTKCYDQDNKENINPVNIEIVLPKVTKRIVSPHLFETQSSNVMSPVNHLKTNIEKDKNLEIDLTLDEDPQLSNYAKQNQVDIYNNTISSSSNFEEVRGLNEISINDNGHICTPTKSLLNYSSVMSTPRPTSAMNISDINDSDMEITQIPLYNSNYILDRQIHDITNANSQTDPKIINENKEIEKILNDFDYNSDECNNDYKTPNKISNSNGKIKPNNGNSQRNYHKDCVVFQRRFDSDDSVSSDEDFRDVAIKENIPLLSNQNSYKQNAVYTTPDKNMFSSNVITTMTTKCQVTPTAIIMHQIQVSAKKSIIYRRKNVKKNLKANKCLHDYYTNLANNLIELRKEAVTLQDQNLNSFNETYPNKTLSLLQPKDVTNDVHYASKKHKTYSRIEQHNSKKNTNTIALHQHHNEMKHLKPKTNFNDECIISNVKRKLYGISSTNDEIIEDLQGNSEQSSSLSYSNITDENNNHFLDSDNNFLNNALENSKTSFKNDVLQILHNHNKNMQLRLNNAHQMCLKNISSFYTKKFCEVAQTVLKKSDEQRIELEQLRCNIRRLVRELQWQCDEFINKYTQFDVHKEITESVLKNITNIDVPNSITKDYEELIKEIHNEQDELVEKVWHKYLEKHNNGNF